MGRRDIFYEEEVENKEMTLGSCIEQIKDWYEKHWVGEWFHLPAHFERFGQASNRYIEGVENKGKDVLQIFSDIKKYNQEYRTQITIDDFKLAMQWVAWTHDLGNGMSGLDEDGAPQWFTSMHADGAEEISKDISKKLMTEAKLPTKIQDLVIYLIEQTKFQKDPQIFQDEYLENMEKPFWAYVQVIDQIGQSWVGSQSDQETALQGLMVELGEKQIGEIKEVPQWMRDFPMTRLVMLIPELARRQILGQMYGKEVV